MYEIEKSGKQQNQRKLISVYVYSFVNMFVEDSEHFSGINGAVKSGAFQWRNKSIIFTYINDIFADFVWLPHCYSKKWEVRCHCINKDQNIFVHCVGLVTRLIDWKLKNDSKNVIKSCIQESIRIKKVKRKCLITFDSDRMNCVLVMRIYIWTDFKISQL